MVMLDVILMSFFSLGPIFAGDEMRCRWVRTAQSMQQREASDAVRAKPFGQRSSGRELICIEFLCHGNQKR